MFERFAPPPHLSGAVEEFWHLQAPGNRTFSGLPKPWVEMIFSLQGRHSWWAGVGLPRYRYDHSWVTPLQSGVRFAHTYGGLDLFGVRLDIFAAHLLFGSRLVKTGNRPFPIKTALGADADELRCLLIPATDAERIGILSRWLSVRIDSLRLRTPPVAELENGGWRVASLAAAMDVGPRALHKMFVKATGRSPKFWLRLARFDRAVQIVGGQPVGVSLADLAAKTGYSDQAHMSRDFAEFGGLTPGAYVVTREGRAIAPPHFVSISA